MKATDLTMGNEHILTRWRREASVANDINDHLSSNRVDGIDNDDQVADDEFPIGLLPPTIRSAISCLDHQRRREALAAQWLLYNWRVIRIETEIIIPATLAMGDAGIPPAETTLLADACHTDEAYHVFLHRSAMKKTLQRWPGLTHLVEQLPTPTAVNSYRSSLSGLSKQRQPIAVIGWAAAAETTINAILTNLPEQTGVRQENRQLVTIHRADERVHALMFRQWLGNAWDGWDTVSRSTFVEALTNGLAALSAPDLATESWTMSELALQTHNTESSSSSQPGQRNDRDNRNLVALARQLQITNEIQRYLE